MNLDESFDYIKSILTDHGFTKSIESTYSYKDIEFSTSISHHRLILDSDILATFFKKPEEDAIILWFDTAEDLEQGLTYYSNLIKRWADHFEKVRPFIEEAIQVLNDLGCDSTKIYYYFKRAELRAYAPVDIPLKLDPIQFNLNEIRYSFTTFEYDSEFASRLKTRLGNTINAFS